MVSGLKKDHKLLGVSVSGVMAQLGHRGYPKVKIRFSHDGIPPPNPVFWIEGVKAKSRESDEGDDAYAVPVL